MARNWIDNLANSPGIRGLFASLVAFAGLMLMAYAIWITWQTIGPASESMPADVRVLNSESSAAASDRDDPPWMALDDGAADISPTSASSNAFVPSTISVITVDRAPTPPMVPAAAATSQPALVTAPTRDASAAAAITDTSGLDNFIWEEDAIDDDLIEVVDVPQNALRAAEANQPIRLVIPSIRVDSPVVNVSLVTTVRRGRLVSTWQVARNAVGFHSTSALPGTLGNTVMSGHNNAWGRVFRDLIRVKRGDEIEVHTRKRVLRYRVEEKLLVRQTGATADQRRRNATWIGPTDDERLTLVSCWPYRRPTHRLIIIARPIAMTSNVGASPS